MHYYKRNIGDYYKKAGRLSMLEHGAYTLLLDSCYDREKFPTLDEAIEWTWAETDEQIAAVKKILSKFFTLEGNVYIQNHIREELERFHENSDTNKRIALEREEKRRTDRARIVNEPPPNHKPITNNQEPKDIKPLSEYSDEFIQFWDMWPKSPRKGSKSKCFKVWKSNNLDSQAGIIFKHIVYCKSNGVWKDPQFISAPLVYLNQAKWDGAEIAPDKQNQFCMDDFLRKVNG